MVHQRERRDGRPLRHLPVEIEQYAASINAIAPTELADDARQTLLAMTAAGRDVYAYATMGTWYVWLETERLTATQWAERHQVLCNLRRDPAAAEEAYRDLLAHRAALRPAIEAAFARVRDGGAMTDGEVAILGGAAELARRADSLRWCFVEVYDQAGAERCDAILARVAVG